MNETGLLRIGELSRRSGVSPELLRAWERRYGLLRPVRSPGRLRLYSPDDLARVRRMQQHLADGLAAAEAAALASRAAADETGDAPGLDVAAARAELAEALDRFDEPTAQELLDRLLAAVTVDTLLGEIVLPYLHELGARWARGESSIAQEHFATGVLRGRMLGLARGWGRGVGPPAVLACLPGERHELGLIAFGLALRSRGWRVTHLGADTPLDTLADAVHVARAAPRRPQRGHRRAHRAGRAAAAGAREAPAARDRRRRRGRRPTRRGSARSPSPATPSPRRSG